MIILAPRGENDHFHSIFFEHHQKYKAGIYAPQFIAVARKTLFSLHFIGAEEGLFLYARTCYKKKRLNVKWPWIK